MLSSMLLAFQEQLGQALPDLQAAHVLKSEVDLTRPPLPLEGEGGALLLRDVEENKIGVFKTSVTTNSHYVNERIAYLLDGGRNVPYTEIVELPKYGKGSLQRYVNNIGTADDFGYSQWSTDNVHAIGILDIRMLNNDRHGGNLLVVEDRDKEHDEAKKRLIAIDHSNCLPDIESPLIGEANFDWLYWPQASEPFSKATLKAINGINLENDIKLLQAYGVPLASCLTLFLTTVILKNGAKMGLTLKQIGSLLQREGDRSKPSVLEQLIAKSKENEEKFFTTFESELNKVLLLKKKENPPLAIKDV